MILFDSCDATVLASMWMLSPVEVHASCICIVEFVIIKRRPPDVNSGRVGLTEFISERHLEN